MCICACVCTCVRACVRSGRWAGGCILLRLCQYSLLYSWSSAHSLTHHYPCSCTVPHTCLYTCHCRLILLGLQFPSWKPSCRPKCPFALGQLRPRGLRSTLDRGHQAQRALLSESALLHDVKGEMLPKRGVKIKVSPSTKTAAGQSKGSILDS